MRAMTLRRLLAAGIAVAAVAAFPSAASAADCTIDLVNDDGITYTIGSDAEINEASSGFAGDVYDGWGYIHNADYESYYPASSPTYNSETDCTYRQDGREVVFPVGVFEGVLAYRTVWVPAEENGARLLTVFVNESDTPITFDWIAEYSFGTDCSNDQISTSSGDEAFTVGDAWAVNAQENGGGHDWAVANVFDSTDVVLDRFDRTIYRLEDSGDDCGDYVETVYEVSLAPGERASYLQFTSVAQTIAAAEGAAAAIAAGADEAFLGMTADEIAALRNFAPGDDADQDGVASSTDNCPTVDNTDQANVDGDAQGDACDGDIDGDSLPNDTESAVGTDPRKADTDGDGVGDAGDGCPTRAGLAANGGCPGDDRPPTVELTSPAGGTKIRPNSPTTLTATAADDGAVAQVLFIDDANVVCTDTAAPYTCDYQPKGEDVGRNTLAAVAVDSSGQTAFDVAAVKVNRFKVTRVTASSSPKSDTTDPRRFTTSGRIELPDALSASDCKGSKVRVTFKSGKKTISSKTVKVSGSCRYSSTKSFGLPERLDDDKLRVFVRFAGNAVLKARRAKLHTVTVR